MKVVAGSYFLSSAMDAAGGSPPASPSVAAAAARNEELADKLAALYAKAEDAMRPPRYDLDAALSLLARVVYLAPRERRVYTLRAEIYLGIGDLQSALANFRRALQLEPEDVLMQKRVAAVLDVQGNQRRSGLRVQEENETRFINTQQ